MCYRGPKLLTPTSRLIHTTAYIPPPRLVLAGVVTMGVRPVIPRPPDSLTHSYYT